MRNIVVIGASSGIGREVADQLLKSGDFVVLCSRRTALLREIHEMYPRNSIVHTLDITELSTLEINLASIFGSVGQVDLLLLASGTGDLNPELSFGLERNTIQTNVEGFTALVDFAFNHFQKQGMGHLAVISSVGGLRGGVAAPAYNASKAYQINYLEALQIKARKLQLPVYVTDLRCGLVDTAMAKGEGLFWISPVPKAATQIIRAISMKKRVAYVTRRWRIIAMVLKILPYSLYSRI